MFYDTAQNNHGLKYNPFKACVIPRPIAWISSIDKNGKVNVAPYSYFNAISDIPPMIMFSSSYKPDGSLKDSIRNIEESGEFVVNVVTYAMIEKMQLSSNPLPYGHSEAEEFDIEMAVSNMVSAPHIKDSPINLECKYVKTVSLDFINEGDKLVKASSMLVIGHVVGVHIADHLLKEGKVDSHALDAVARLGYSEYARVNDIFTMNRI